MKVCRIKAVLKGISILGLKAQKRLMPSTTKAEGFVLKWDNHYALLQSVRFSSALQLDCKNRLYLR